MRRGPADIAGLFGRPDSTAVVEERLDGPRASVIALTDGRDLVGLPAARDHKRLLDGDRGPNTGGMGAYSPLPDVDDDLVDGSSGRPSADPRRAGRAWDAVRRRPLRRPHPDRERAVLLECNARFGDPGTQVVLPGSPAHSARSSSPPPAGSPPGGRRDGHRRGRLPVLPGATVGIVLAGGGYPASSSHGDRIEGLEDAEERGGLVFHAGTRRAAAVTRRTAAGSSRSSGGAPTSPRPGSRPTTLPTPSASRASAAVATSEARRSGRTRPAARGRPWSPERRHDPALHAPGDGLDLDRRGPVRRDAPGRARRRLGQGRPRPRPQAALATIRSKARIDTARIAEIERTTDHDVIAFVSQVAETIGPEGRYLHLGLTSSDVVDTGLALQLKAAGERLLADADRLVAALVRRARDAADTVMMGWTHGGPR